MLLNEAPKGKEFFDIVLRHLKPVVVGLTASNLTDA
jgi:hypothetical protein